MLHLQGDNNTNFPAGGWRSWMKTGMFASENSDAMYEFEAELVCKGKFPIITNCDDELCLICINTQYFFDSGCISWG